MLQVNTVTNNKKIHILSQEWRKDGEGLHSLGFSKIVKGMNLDKLFLEKINFIIYFFCNNWLDCRNIEILQNRFNIF